MVGPADVVHACRRYGLDAFVYLCGGDCETARSAESYRSDTLPVHEGARTDEIDAGAEILDEDVRRGDMAGFSAALPVV